MAFKAAPSAYKANIAKKTGKMSASELAEITKPKNNWRVDEDHALQPRSQVFLGKQLAQGENDVPLASHALDPATAVHDLNNYYKEDV